MLHQRIVQVVAGWVALCHVALGIAGLLADAAMVSWMVRVFYAATVDVTPTLLYVVKLLAAYYVAFGGLAVIIAVKPRQYVGLVPVLIVFFVVRVFQLVYFSTFLASEFQVPDNRLVEKIVSYIIIAALLAWSGHQLRRQAASVPGR